MRSLFYFIFLFVITLTLFTRVKSVSAQSCGGSVNCCDMVTSCLPIGCGEFGKPACTSCTSQCGTQNAGYCGPIGGGCGPICPGTGDYDSQNCYTILDNCPIFGEEFCDGCINACRNTALKNCTQWIAQECSGGGGPGPCTPSCSTQCGQGDGCSGTCGSSQTGVPGTPKFTVVTAGTSGGNYDATESIYFFRTDNDNGMITVEWTNGGGNSNLVEYRFYPSDVNGTATSDSSGNSGCNNLFAKCSSVDPSVTSIEFRPRANRYYQMRLRKRSVCGTWGAWGEQTFRIDGQITGKIILDNNGSATATGIYGTCSDAGGNDYTATSINVTSSGQGYSDADGTGAAGRYRTYLPYQNLGNPTPGNVAISLSGLPADYVVSCPEGGAYGSPSTLGAPLLDNGRAGNVLDANFYICSAGTSVPVPTNLSPANGTNVTFNSGVTPISWSAGSGGSAADRYDVQVMNSAEVGSVSADPNNTNHCFWGGAACSTNQAGTSYNFNLTNGIYIYAYRVRAVSSSCGGVQGTWSNWTYFGIADTITGAIYLDPNTSTTISSGLCIAGGGAAATAPGAGAGISSVGVDGLTRTGVFNGSAYGLYTYVWSPGNNTLTLNPGSDINGLPYTCSCPAGCQYSGISSPAVNVNFFIQESILVNSGWFQTRGGNAYAGFESGTALRSYIPATYCTSGVGCIPYVLATDFASTVDSAGIALTGGGAIDTTKDLGNSTAQTTQRTTQAAAVGTANDRLFENYAFFYREFSLGTNPTDDFSSTATNALKPTTAPNDGKRAYYHNGNLIVQTPWTVAANESITVIVNGNLNLRNATATDQLITVAPGGYLSFVVSGNITIESTVGNTNANDVTTPNIEGVYIANGQIITESVGTAGGGDKPFVGAGTFVGWGGIDLGRDFDDGGQRKAENNTKPIETFIFRPDFVLNVPPEITRSSYIWKETN